MVAGGPKTFFIPSSGFVPLPLSPAFLTFSYMSTRLEPTNVAAIGQELAIAWSDGAEHYFTFEALRRACPCAGCCGEPDAMGNLIRPEVKYRPNSFELRGWQYVGGYALQPLWADGHDSGLYSFTYLRKLAAQPKA